MATTQIRTLIFDIGDVLCTWNPKTSTSLPGKLLKEFRLSPIWYEYNCGRIGEEECYTRLAASFSVPYAEIEEAFSQARNSQAGNDAMVAAIRELKLAHKDSLRIYAMSNVSRPDWEILKTKPIDWSIFDRVFTSSEAGMSKPELQFYRYVLRATDTAPQEAVFVDDKADNVLAARSLGIHGIQFDNSANVLRQLQNILGNPTQRGKKFLSSHAHEFHSVTDQGHVVPDNFSQLLMLEATGNPDLISLEYHEKSWNYFIGSPFGTTKTYPDDVDTTSLALMLLSVDDKVAHSVLDDMLRHLSADGIVMIYFDESRARTDPIVCINVVRLFYHYGRGNQPELQPTKNWICEVLLNRAYLEGTRYYTSPDVFFYFFSRLLEENGGSDIYQATASLLKERLQERVGANGDSLELSMRILACYSLGIRDEMGLNKLLSLQCEDGGWEIGWLCRYGKTGMRLGNKGVGTALAINAYQALRGREKSVADSDEAISMTPRREPTP
ncbi:MAG: hypothetical protein M1834_002092 [Cirrosporium novae-zelandiae]|nr:MAG: hypothetical protein M1834_002092 [Cirrosporium novae-zelandiae]